MKQDHDFDTGDPLRGQLYDFVWGMVLTPILTYPLTMYVFSGLWVQLSLCLKVAWLASGWLVVSVWLVQPCRKYLARRSQQRAISSVINTRA